MDVSAYLSFNGDCEEAFLFYEEVLGGTIEAMITHDQTPMADKVPPEWQKKIIHARLAINGTMIMGGDAPPEHYKPPNGFSLLITTKTSEEAERYFTILSQKGTVRMALQQTFWAQRFAMVVDRYGIPWMISCPK